MKKRYLTKSAVFLVIEDEEAHYLLQRRLKTGYRDGWLDLGASGHVEAGETAKQAARRELLEETGLAINLDRLRFMAVAHRNTDNQVYYDFYFHVKITNAEKAVVRINEPEKVSEMIWIHQEALPDDLIEYSRNILQRVQQGDHYFEIGWADE
ncbi:NUDIX domain-containing protein [Tuanshanicoccus lijuaniae]|uniref:NUDIX domain-containing protein n=1 Tax=Aerococcaceae bacterium zg-1292 TaxID=2774330 RepID=UPI001BD88497|nr:NUDIX domain-containing protein [Aerococcaceae bacterium zg-A91]MBS4457408.1 NUDIX domain-containing protein [Aerococcaceae bacterium zg-BR33]